jgi:nucleoside-diphosphate-sugar epimerase
MALLRASLHLARTLAESGCRRLVVTGSLFEYADATGQVTESSPTRPRHLYAASKLALFEALAPYCRLAGMELAWPRLFYQYGPYENPQRLIPVVINALLRGQRAELTPGEQVGDYLHVEDTAAAIGAVARSSVTGAVNIGSGQAVRIRDVALRIGQFLERPDLIVFGAKPYTPDAPMNLVADTTRLRQQTDWQPRFTLDSGLRQTIAWWKDRR